MRRQRVPVVGSLLLSVAQSRRLAVEVDTIELPRSKPTAPMAEFLNAESLLALMRMYPLLPKGEA